MTLPSIEPLPEENPTLPPARRRRQRRTVLPTGEGERADFLRQLSYRTVPSFDFFLFSLLAGITLGVALLLDAPALFVLAALLAPFMAPAIGIALGTITGTLRFVLQSLGSLSIGSLFVFLCGAAAGWAANLIPGRGYQQAIYHSHFTWPDFFVLVVGAALTTYLLVRTPNQRPLVSSVAIAYGLYLPAGAAGFGMTSTAAGLWPDALILFVVHLVWAVVASVVVFSFFRLHPQNVFGYLLGGLYAIAGIAGLVILLTHAPVMPPASNPKPAGIVQATATRLQQTPSPNPLALTGTLTRSPANTPTPLSTPTRTLVPSQTPTLTITPVPTPIWARINASEGDGALVRAQPDYNATVVGSLLNGTLVEVLPDVTSGSGTAWVHIRMVNGKDGWIVRTLLRTATPAPNW